jgi:hypothetical protein
MHEPDIITVASLTVELTKREAHWWRAALSDSCSEEESRTTSRLLVESLCDRQAHYRISDIPQQLLKDK